MNQRTKFLLPSVTALGMTAVTAAAAFFTLRNLGGLIRRFGDGFGEETKLLLADVFQQLSHARVLPHLLLPLLLWLIYGLLMFRTKGKGKSILYPLTFLGGYVPALLLAEVNGIRFWDVVSSLVGIIANGGLDSL